MLGRRRNNATGMPVHANAYDERDAAALSTYNADLVPPATSYAASHSQLRSQYHQPTIGVKTGGFFPIYKWRRNGLKYNWAWGGVDMGKHMGSLPGVDGGLNGFVRSAKYQTILVQLHDWQTNSRWFQAGWNGTGSGMFNGSKDVRYTYPSFRVSQINTMVSGNGPTTMHMQPRPRFTSVQRVPRPQPPFKRVNPKPRNG